MFIILVYDVNVKRGTKVMKVCKKYLHHVQKSVFEGQITELNLKQMRMELGKVIETETDSIYIYHMESVKFADKIQIGLNAEISNVLWILSEIRDGTYRPGIVQEKEIVMANGKRRKIVIYTCTDRLILRAICSVMQEKLDSLFSEYSYAYRQNRSMVDAVDQAAAYIQTGKKWVVEIDIADFFDEIDLDRMMGILMEEIDDSSMLMMLRRYLYCDMEQDYRVFQRTKGLTQGCSISPVLSNLYLNELDVWLTKQNLTFCRFADNINIYVKDRNQALRWYKKIEELLKARYHLYVNVQKSGVFPAISRYYLGYEFFTDKAGKVLVRKKKRKPQKHYRDWHHSALQYYNKDYHIINDGILTKGDYTVLFENESGKQYLPVETMGNLNVYSNVIFSTNFFEFMNQHNHKVTIYDKHGKLVGTFYSAKHSRAAALVLKQAALYNDEIQRLELAKRIMVAAVHNMRANLRYYNKKGKELEQGIKEMTNSMKEINEARSIEHLMMAEARCRQNYYRCMDQIIDNPEFVFAGRNKRPPEDPVNALISFGNVFLYNILSTEITKASLDVRIGILHSTNKRSESFNLDIAEIFKPVIVDRVVFTMIHKRIIHAEEHFERFGEKGIYLNDEGKRVFIECLKKAVLQSARGWQGDHLSHAYEKRSV